MITWKGGDPLRCAGDCCADLADKEVLGVPLCSACMSDSEDEPVRVTITTMHLRMLQLRLSELERWIKSLGVLTGHDYP